MEMGWEVAVMLYEFFGKQVWYLEKLWADQEYGEFGGLSLFYALSMVVLIMAVLVLKRTLRWAVRLVIAVLLRKIADRKQRALWLREQQRIKALRRSTEEALKNLGAEASVPHINLHSKS